MPDTILEGDHPKINQTLVEWSLDGPLPKLCPVIPTSNQDGHQAKNRKRGDEIKQNLLLCRQTHFWKRTIQ
jgi:hypothetical protein